MASDFKKELDAGRKCFYALHPPECPADLEVCARAYNAKRLEDHIKWIRECAERAEKRAEMDRADAQRMRERLAEAEASRIWFAEPIEITLFVGEQELVHSEHGEFLYSKSRIAAVRGEPRLVPGVYQATLRRKS